MQRFELRYPIGEGEHPDWLSLDVPDIVTALVVADILNPPAALEIRDGDQLLATIANQGHAGAPLWRVG